MEEFIEQIDETTLNKEEIKELNEYRKFKEVFGQNATFKKGLLFNKFYKRDK